jgi:Eco57I restriction-modification methylase
MATLSRDLRRELERVIIQARRVGVEGAIKALEQLAVANDKPWSSMTDEQKRLRVRLRAHGRQLGDKIDARGAQSIRHLAQECAYEHWHRMLFARFLAESNLLIEPKSGVAISLDECRELARQQGKDWLVLASEFAVRMLPQIFRSSDPVLEISLPPETRNQLEALLKSLPAEVFAADDSLGWVYQFWQSEEKKRVNDSGVKIGADELPAVTELFTEDYMVFFLLHNTLGAWWTAKRKAEGKDPNLPGYEWTYLRLKEDGTPAAGNFDGWPRAAKDIKVLDPSMGSGHFLVFALPILVGFRMEEEGLSREQAVEAVLRDNLFGLEIDPRCTQIAPFNLAWTAWRMVGYRPLPQLNLACSGLGVNAKEDDWVKLAGKEGRARETMRRLFHLFQQAPTLGSLIDPKRVGGSLFTVEFEKVRPLLQVALADEHVDEGEIELAVAAQGLVRAAGILTNVFTLVITNVPYLGRGKQNEILKDYCDRYHPAAKADLATCFVERTLSLCSSGATVALVTTQNWLFLGRYKPLRQSALKEYEWNVVARLGARAFETVSGEIVSVALAFLTRRHTDDSHCFAAFDVSSKGSPAEKSAGLQRLKFSLKNQKAQLANPDARIVLDDIEQGTRTLSDYVESYQGAVTGDLERFTAFVWEVIVTGNTWEPFRTAIETADHDNGLMCAIRWEGGNGQLAEYARESRKQLHDMHESGQRAWGQLGIAVNRMTNLLCTRYTGMKFDNNVAVLVLRSGDHLLPVLAFCSSEDFPRAVRALDQTLKVTNQTLRKVPFDLPQWEEKAGELWPDGVPVPPSSDPTQWVFDGKPNHSNTPLHVAMCRLLDFRWPRQAGVGFVDHPSFGPDGLEKHADVEGITCLASLQGERPATERLRALLSDAFGSEWSAAKQNELLTQVGYAGKALGEWLRDAFFQQHCELFHHRPFIWHIWDGLRDGFHALVNYHKLAAPNGVGRQTLQKLTYSYLGDWIERQRADQKNGVDGADGRLAAALYLKKELEKILEGEPPYDIFVRWKPLHEQPLGWEPDINDGVRINIRPFMMAGTIKGNKNGCILRVTPKVKWEKDRGKEPHRPKEDFPWFWKWDGKTQDFSGGSEFDGNRWNDLHYSLEKKHEARKRHGVGKPTKKTQEAGR